jgi:VWFA-related protein
MWNRPLFRSRAKSGAALAALASMAVFASTGHSVSTALAQTRAARVPPPAAAPEPDEAASLPAEASAHGSPVRIDVTVTDREGRPVAGLTRGDFELVDAGVVQAVDVREGPLAGEVGGRIFGVFFDEYHVAAGESTDRARNALSDFMHEVVRPDDQLVILKPLDRLQSIRATNDVVAMRARVASLTGRMGDYAPTTAFERNFMAAAPPAVDAERIQIVTSGLQALAQSIGHLPARRKALLVLSEGFVPVPRRSLQSGRDPIQNIIGSANRFGIAIYGIDPGVRETHDVERTAVLAELANQTGGRAAISGSDLSAVLRGISRELDASYVLTYPAPHPADGRFHPVQVRVKKPDVTVRARTGYWAPLASPSRTDLDRSLARTTVPARPTHRSPLIRPWFGIARNARGVTQMSVTWEPETKPGIKARAEGASLRVTTDRAVLFEGPLAPVRPVTGEPPVPPERAMFEVRPGRVELVMTITDATGGVVDTDVRSMDVPKFDTRTVIATPEVFRARTARELALIRADVSAAPVSSREFNRTERLLIRVPAYGPDGVQPKVTARLLNAIRRPMRELTAVPSERLESTTEVDVPLSSLAPGDYGIELTAKGPDGEAKETLLFRVSS